MKTIQIEASKRFTGNENSKILKAAGVQRIHDGWYTVTYNGVMLDRSTVTSAKRNHGGLIT